MSATLTSKTPTNFHLILQQVRDAGLLSKRPSFYVIRLAVISVIASALWVGAGFAGYALDYSQWWIIAGFFLAGLLGIMSAQYGFIAHEASHRQVFRNNKANDWLGLVLANYLFPFLLLFTGFDLLVDSFAGLKRKERPLKVRILEFSLMMVRQTAPYFVMALMFGWLWAIALWLFMMMTFGFFMGAAFAPNHKGMPLVEKDSKLDFFSRQVLTSRNIKGSWLKDNLMGGLNYQVEHHLFPSMARPNLRKAHQLVSEFCEKNGITMVEMNLLASYVVIMKHLNKVGLSNNADPFVCPMVAELRPRS